MDDLEKFSLKISFTINNQFCTKLGNISEHISEPSITISHTQSQSVSPSLFVTGCYLVRTERRPREFWFGFALQ